MGQRVLEEDKPEYTFVDFVNEIQGFEGADKYDDEEELCKAYTENTINYLWELYQSLK